MVWKPLAVPTIGLWMCIFLIPRDSVPVQPVSSYLYQGVHQRVQQGDDIMSEVASLCLQDQKARSVLGHPPWALGCAGCRGMLPAPG